MDTFFYWLCIYGITGCIITLIMLLLWWPAFDTSTWRSSLKEMMLCVWLWPYFILLIAGIFWTRIWSKKPSKTKGGNS